MSDKFVYQNARVKSMESSLFTAQSVGRLLDCTSSQAAFRVLLEMGYGAGTSVEEGDFDALFALEEERAAEFLREFNVDGALDPLLVGYDFLNLKALFKSSITGKEAVTAPVGKYDLDEIKQWLEQDGAGDAPKYFAETVNGLKQLLQSQSAKVSPHSVDCIVDKASFAYVLDNKKKVNKNILSYFVRKVDGMNVSSFIRCKRLELPLAYFEEGFIEGGELDFLPKIYDSPLEVLKERCKRTPYEGIVSQVVDDGNLVAFEVAQDNALFKMWKDLKDDLFDVSPIVAYYLTKITQIRVAKLAVAGIKNGVEQAKIKERMRDLYA